MLQGNDIEGNAGGQINCDSLCGSTFKDNHFENQRTAEGSAVAPMSFGSRPIPSSGIGATIGRNAHFSKIEDGDTLILKLDKGNDPITVTFTASDRDVKKIIRKINEKVSEIMKKVLTIASESTVSESKGQLMLASPTDLKLEPPPAPRLTIEELRPAKSW